MMKCFNVSSCLRRVHSTNFFFRSITSDNSKYNEYRHPLITRYASSRMRNIWSEQSKFETWRKLWVALATAQYELGLKGITLDQINELKSNISNIDFEYAEMCEKTLKHDVMSHIHTFGHQCPSASGIIHLGATSCYVQDNCDLYLMRESGNVLKSKLLSVMLLLRNLSIKYSDLPCLGYTHLQAAQLTTVGKRFAGYLQDFYYDYLYLTERIDNLAMRGAKGTTGTQASFLALFDNDHSAVREMEISIMKYMGFNSVLYLTGQTYPRKIDYNILVSLSNISQSSYKISNDIRLLQSLHELEEPFLDKTQIGSSAMAYKRNPILSERICSLSRYLNGLPSLMGDTYSTQWLERSLDDSAIRRIIIPESFLCCDSILDILYNVLNNIQIWPNVINSNILSEIPFIATENIIMECVKKGANRQEIHEIIRIESMESAKNIKENGTQNDLLDKLKNNCEIQKYLNENDINNIINPNHFIGRAPEQIKEFINDIIDPLLNDNQSILNAEQTDTLNV